MYLPSRFQSKYIVVFLLLPVLFFLPAKRFIQHLIIFTARTSFHYSRGGMIQKLADLQNENINLRLRLKQFHHLKEENESLRKALDISQSKGIVLTGAYLVAFSPSNWRQFAIIDKGKTDGVFAGMFAVDENGYLIGKIDEVNQTDSRLIFVGDPEFTASVHVGDLEFGLLSGNLIGATVQYIENGESIRPGDRIWLGLSSSNIPLDVGTVSRIQKNEDNLFWDVSVRLFREHTYQEKVFLVHEK